MSDLEQRIAETVAALREAAREQGMTVTVDGRVKEADAEILCSYCPGSFRRFRKYGTAAPFFRAAIDGARISYRLADLSRWLESRREVPEL